MGINEAYEAAAHQPQAVFEQRKPEPDFTLQFEGGITILYPQTDNAEGWAEEHLPLDDMQEWSGGYVIETHYIMSIIQRIEADGLKVER